jgi:hypothetical protein
LQIETLASAGVAPEVTSGVTAVTAGGGVDGAIVTAERKNE